MMKIATRVILPSLALLIVVSPLSAQRSRPGWIGISLDMPTVDGRVMRDSAVVIGEVRRGSPAEEAGLRRGDRLLAIGDLRRPDEFQNLPERLRLRVGDRVRIRVERDSRRIEVVVRAAERPDDVTSRTILLAMEPDSMVETMMRAMDSLRVHLVAARQGGGRVTTSDRPVRVVRQEQSPTVGAPFEFFVFRGEEHDSLRRAMEDLNRLSEELRQREATRVDQLRRGPSARDFGGQDDEQLRTVRTALEDVTRESAVLRAAMSEAARITAGFDYTAPAWSYDPADTPGAASATPFSPLTPYLLGSNRVAGAQVIDLRPELARYFDVEGGVLIIDVPAGTPAAMAGMLPGDVITRLDQVTVRSVEELRFGITRADDSLPITLVRQGGSLEVLLRRR